MHSLASARKNSLSSVEIQLSPPSLGSISAMNSSIDTRRSSASVSLIQATAWTFADSQSSFTMMSKVAWVYSNRFSKVIEPHCSSREPPPPSCSLRNDSSSNCATSWFAGTDDVSIENIIRRAMALATEALST